MKYKDVIEKLEEYNLVESYDKTDIEFVYLSYNSKDVKKDTLFVCKGVEFKENYFPTAGVDFAITILKSHNKVVKCQIWDTGGNKQFIGTIQHYEIGVNIFFVLFDITARRTFDEVDYCYNNAISEKGKNMLMYLIGNKSDLEDKREVTVKEA